MYQTIEAVVGLGTIFTSALYVFRSFSNMYMNSSRFFYCGEIQNTYNIKFMYINFEQKIIFKVIARDK